MNVESITYSIRPKSPAARKFIAWKAKVAKSALKHAEYNPSISALSAVFYTTWEHLSAKDCL